MNRENLPSKKGRYKNEDAKRQSLEAFTQFPIVIATWLKWQVPVWLHHTPHMLRSGFITPRWTSNSQSWLRSAIISQARVKEQRVTLPTSNQQFSKLQTLTLITSLYSLIFFYWRIFFKFHLTLDCNKQYKINYFVIAKREDFRGGWETRDNGGGKVALTGCQIDVGTLTVLNNCVKFHFLNKVKRWERSNSCFPLQSVDSRQPLQDPVGRPVMHLSGLKHATGEAIFCDDIPKMDKELFMVLMTSTRAHAKIM